MRQNKNRPYLIGVTGGVGSGKSALLEYIGRHYSCRVYLADEVAKKLQEPGEKCYQEMVGLLGEEILDPTGRINRAKVAQRLFQNERLLEKVNGMVHPLVKEYLMKEIKGAAQNHEIELIFIEAALLIECGYSDIVDEMWYIYTDVRVRKERLREGRGYSDEKIQQIMEAQLSEEEYKKHCDFMINNSTDLETSYDQIRSRLEEFTWQN